MKTTKTPAGQRTRAVIYVRISQDRTGAGLGVDRQREDCEALAARNGWDVVEVYVDNDISAYSGKRRPGYRQMLSDLSGGSATVVIAWHNDRLHRSPTELEEYIDISDRHGVSTHTVMAGHLDLSTPSGRMTARIHGAVARHESEHKAERVARARMQKAMAGEWGGGIRPFGWGLPTGEMKKAVDKKTGEETEVPVLDMNKAVPEEAAAIVHGHDMLLTGQSLRSWIRWLADKGFLTPRGNPIGHVEGRDMLLRPRNAGIAVYKGEEVGTGLWERLVPVEKHRAVVAVLKDPTRRTSPGAAPKWFGSLIYECPHPGCAKTLRVTKGGRAKLPGYRCADNHGGARSVERLDEYIEDVIIERLSRPDAADLLQPSPEGIDVPALQKESEEIRRRLTDLAALFGSGQIDMVQFTQGSDTARAQLEGVNVQLARSATRDPLVSLVGVPDVRAAWKQLDLEQRRNVLRTLMRVRVHKSRPGRMPDGGYFDYESIEILWRRVSAPSASD
ncbi:DNA invertase Pin-like site-specific DNA recombinase [Streptomyces sp. PvR006]|uniref:recombinase family protein n=1 Tax=Streptomyces sp. PvR006 TaxID=2817860 RepID=UPI001AE973B8|nr:recombinase family protein [Streptomyces sp. PvR006]MBP2582995.1 DNA invertase Pin-like site-specific DNA recombinase [Streptomyces sp. PvR006]